MIANVGLPPTKSDIPFLGFSFSELMIVFLVLNE